MASAWCLLKSTKWAATDSNYGSVPSKALLAAAKRANAHANCIAVRHARRRTANRSSRRAGACQRRIARIAPNAAVERFAGLGMRVITAAGRFVDKSTVSAGDYRIRARRFVIATGSSPVIPPIPGLADVPYFTNELIFENAAPLPHLIVIGAGSTGLEFAQAYRRLGSRLTVIDSRPCHCGRRSRTRSHPAHPTCQRRHRHPRRRPDYPCLR